MVLASVPNRRKANAEMMSFHGGVLFISTSMAMCLLYLSILDTCVYIYIYIDTCLELIFAKRMKGSTGWNDIPIPTYTYIDVYTYSVGPLNGYNGMTTRTNQQASTDANSNGTTRNLPFAESKINIANTFIYRYICMYIYILIEYIYI